MSMFPAVNIAGTGLEVDQTWIDAIGGNVANARGRRHPRPAGLPRRGDRRRGGAGKRLGLGGQRRRGDGHRPRLCARHPHLRPE